MEFLNQYITSNKRLIIVVIILMLLTFVIGTSAFVYLKDQQNADQSELDISFNWNANQNTQQQTNDNVSYPNDDTNSVNTDQNEDTNLNNENNSNGQNENPNNNNPNNNNPNPNPDPNPQPPDNPEPPAPESPSAIVAFYSDNQSDTDAEDQNHQRVVNYILNTSASVVFNAGDIMEDGTQASLDRFNSISSGLRAARTFYAALGNNDRKYGDASTPSQLFLDNFVFPNNEQWYSVNVGNLHMVILDSAFSASSQAQLNWLVADLQSSASQTRIIGVMFHHPDFKNTISTYLINYGADFVISGHNHVYNHTIANGINYFITTGQPNLGYFLAQIYSNKATITVYNQNNSVVENVEFNER